MNDMSVSLWMVCRYLIWSVSRSVSRVLSWPLSRSLLRYLHC